MPTKTMTTLQALASERRTNRRLRALIKGLTAQVAGQRHDLDLQFVRIAQLQADIDLLKKS